VGRFVTERVESAQPHIDAEITEAVGIVLAQVIRELDDGRVLVLDAFFTRFIFRFGLLRRACSREALETLVAHSRFRTGVVEAEGIGFELRLTAA
jgi:hypothetical protein